MAHGKPMAIGTDCFFIFGLFLKLCFGMFGTLSFATIGSLKNLSTTPSPGLAGSFRSPMRSWYPMCHTSRKRLHPHCCSSPWCVTAPETTSFLLSFSMGILLWHGLQNKNKHTISAPNLGTETCRNLKTAGVFFIFSQVLLDKNVALAITNTWVDPFFSVESHPKSVGLTWWQHSPWISTTCEVNEFMLH